MTQASSRSDGSPTIECTHCGDPHPASYTHCPKTGKPLAAGKALVGRLIADRYKIVGVLGEGGMGAVYVAEHLLIGRKVALKRLHPELASDAKSVARFQREARAAAATGHENIVEILDLGFAEDGAPFLVMEYLRGHSLATRLRKEGRLAPARACHIVGQVLAALDAVHRSHIVHRDLKPDNILLTRRSGRSDYVKVLDFGISKMRKEDEDALDLTKTGVMLGTPFYMSPEQARGMKSLDHRVDLYSVGVILYESLAGRLPFEGGNYHALLQAILVGDPPRLADLESGIDPRLTDAVHRAIARKPEDRFQTAREMLEALVPFGAVDPGPPDAGGGPAESDHEDLRPTTSRGEQSASPRGAAADRERQGLESTRPVQPGSDLRPSSSWGGASTSSPGLPAVDEQDEMAELVQRLPHPQTMAPTPRPFQAESDDWVAPYPDRGPSGVRSGVPRIS